MELQLDKPKGQTPRATQHFLRLGSYGIIHFTQGNGKLKIGVWSSLFQNTSSTRAENLFQDFRDDGGSGFFCRFFTNFWRIDHLHGQIPRSTQGGERY